jgi:prevent-host-death family protein
MTQTMTISDIEREFGNLVKRVSKHETRVVVEDRGTPVAAIVSTEDLQRLTQLDKQRDKAWQILDGIHARNRDKDPDEVQRDVAEPIAEVREEERSTHRTKQSPSKTGHEAFLAAAGGWRGLIDPEKFKEDIAAARGSDRPPINPNL